MTSLRSSSDLGLLLAGLVAAQAGCSSPSGPANYDPSSTGEAQPPPEPEPEPEPMLPDCCPGTGGDPTPEPLPPPDEPLLLDHTTCTAGRSSPLGYCYHPGSVSLFKDPAWPLDLDGDGQTDFVTDGLWYVLANDDGTLPHVAGPDDDDVNLTLVVDLDLDGDKEIVRFSKTAMSIAHHDTPGRPTWTPIAEDIDDATLTDVDGIPPLDIAFIESDFDRVGILRADGKGSYDEVQWMPFGNNPLEVVSVDWDHDGRLDLVGSAANDDALVVRRGQGSYFGAPQLIGVGSSPRGLATGDLDGDGHDDVVVANALSHDLTVVLTRSSVGPQLLTTPAHHIHPRQLATFDYDGDGRSDVAVRALDDSIDLMWATETGQLEYRATHVIGKRRALEAFDFDEDGTDELLVSYSQSGPSLFTVTDEAATVLADVAPYGVGKVADMDGDGTDDLMLAHGRHTVLDLRSARGPMRWGVHRGVSHIVGVTDVQGDGSVDVLAHVSQRGPNGYGVVYGGSIPPSPPEVFAEAWPVGRGQAQYDLNGDGVLDVFGVNQGQCQAILSNGRGGFATTTDLVDPCVSPSVADFDGDGDVDLVDLIDGNLTVYSNDGTGAFTTTLELPIESSALLGVGDLEGDGELDLFTRQGCCRLGISPLVDGTIIESRRVLVGDAVSTAQIWDLDGDGATEILLTLVSSMTALVDEGEHWVGYRVSSSDDCTLPARDVNGDGIADLSRGFSDCLSIRD